MTKSPEAKELEAKIDALLIEHNSKHADKWVAVIVPAPQIRKVENEDTAQGS